MLDRSLTCSGASYHGDLPVLYYETSLWAHVCIFIICWMWFLIFVHISLYFPSLKYVFFPLKGISHEAPVSFHSIRCYYLFRSTQGRGTGEQDGPLGVLNKRCQNLCPCCVPGFEVMWLVHHDHSEPLPAQSLHQGACICGEQAVTQHRHLTAADTPGVTRTHTQYADQSYDVCFIWCIIVILFHLEYNGIPHVY